MGVSISLILPRNSSYFGNASALQKTARNVISNKHVRNSGNGTTALLQVILLVEQYYATHNIGDSRASTYVFFRKGCN